MQLRGGRLLWRVLASGAVEGVGGAQLRVVLVWGRRRVSRRLDGLRGQCNGRRAMLRVKRRRLVQLVLLLFMLLLLLLVDLVRMREGWRRGGVEDVVLVGVYGLDVLTQVV